MDSLEQIKSRLHSLGTVKGFLESKLIQRLGEEDIVTKYSEERYAQFVWKSSPVHLTGVPRTTSSRKGCVKNNMFGSHRGREEKKSPPLPSTIPTSDADADDDMNSQRQSNAGHLNPFGSRFPEELRMLERTYA
jgi:hypothetical protein